MEGLSLEFDEKDIYIWLKANIGRAKISSLRISFFSLGEFQYFVQLIVLCPNFYGLIMLSILGKKNMTKKVKTFNFF